MAVLLLVAGCGGATEPIAPSDSALQPVPGLSYDSSGGYHVVVADVSGGAIEVRVTQPHARDVADMETVSGHAIELSAAVAINANYFGGPLNHPCGAARGFGVQYTDAYREAVNCESSLGWSPHGGAVAAFDSLGHEADAGLEPQLSEAVTGGGYLLLDGQRHDWNHGKLEAGRDCSALGISADGKRFIFVGTDDNVCTGAGLQDVLLGHGAANAVQLDGGGSTKLWIRGRGYVNVEAEDRQPPVAIVARPAGADACRDTTENGWYCGSTLPNGDQRSLYTCNTGFTVARVVCTNGCKVNPPGVADACK
jgi:hypothetical protein